jgi:hypothetical protein
LHSSQSFDERPINRVYGSKSLVSLNPRLRLTKGLCPDNCVTDPDG